MIEVNPFRQPSRPWLPNPVIDFQRANLFEIDVGSKRWKRRNEAADFLNKVHFSLFPIFSNFFDFFANFSKSTERNRRWPWQTSTKWRRRRGSTKWRIFFSIYSPFSPFDRRNRPKWKMNFVGRLIAVVYVPKNLETNDYFNGKWLLLWIIPQFAAALPLTAFEYSNNRQSCIFFFECCLRVPPATMKQKKWENLFFLVHFRRLSGVALTCR